MGYRIFALLLLCLALFASAQNTEAEALEAQLKGSLGDERIGLLSDLVQLYRDEEPDKAIKFGQELLEVFKSFPRDTLKLDVLIAMCKSSRLNSDLKAAVRYGRQAVQLADDLGSQEKLALSQQMLGRCYLLMGDNTQSLSIYMASLANWKELGESLTVGKVNHQLGTIYYYMGQYHMALEYHQMAWENFSTLDRKKEIAMALDGIGADHFGLGQFETALEYFHKAFALKESLEKPEHLAHSYDNLGVAYSGMGRYEKALEMLFLGFELHKQNDDQQSIALSLYNQGGVYLKMERLNLAEETMREALKLMMEQGNKSSIADIHFELGKIYNLQEKFDEALDEFNRSLSYAVPANNQQAVRDSYELLSEVYERFGRYKDALVAYRRFKEAGDEIFNKESSERIASLNASFKASEAQRELVVLRKERDLTKAELQLQKQWRYSLIAALLVLFLVLFLFYYRHVNQKQLSQERQVIEQLKHVDKMKDEFLANTSHELRTPLNGIIGLAESLMDGGAGPMTDKAAGELAMIIDSGKRLTGLVNELLDFSKMQTQALDLHLKAVDLHSLTEVVLTTLRPLANHKSLKLVNRIGVKAPAVSADENRLQQILHNLVGNAVKFSEQGSIVISAKAVDEFVEISVTDSGIGIPASQHEQIFQSFEQGDGSSDKTYAGTGLGLAVAKKLVELHGGLIRVESKVGQGSTFTFSLPVSNERPSGLTSRPTHLLGRVRALPGPEDVETVVATLEPAGAEFRILIVDDDEINRRVLTNFLAKENYELIEAENGVVALEMIKHDPAYHLVLLDVMMPRLSGYEVCKQIREQYDMHELPVIFLTAKDQVADLMTAFNVGGNDYLTKPVHKGELLPRVRTQLQVLDTNRNLEQKVTERTLELEERNDELETLDGIVKAINLETAFDKLLNTLLLQGKVLFPQAEACAFLIWDMDAHCFKIGAAIGFGNIDVNQMNFPSKELSRYVTSDDEIASGLFLIRDFDAWRDSGHLDELALPKSMVAMSVTLHDKPEGFVIWNNYSDVDAFSAEDAGKLERFRDHATSAVVKARLLHEVSLKNDELVRTQNKLIMQEKMASLGTLTAGIAHEIRNPLNFINNFADVSQQLVSELRDDLLAEKTHLPEQTMTDLLATIDDLAEDAHQIIRHGERANRIVETMLMISHEAGDKPQPTDIHGLLVEARDLVLRQKRIEPNRIDLKIEVPAGMGHWHVMPKDFGRAMTVLIDNAVDAVLEKEGQDFKPEIVIRADRHDDRLELAIRDNGVGIDPQHQKKIYTPFFTTKNPEEGIGLGLYICYEIIVQQHHGEIKMTTQPGSHTEFRVNLTPST